MQSNKKRGLLRQIRFASEQSWLFKINLTWCWWELLLCLQGFCLIGPLVRHDTWYRPYGRLGYETPAPTGCFIRGANLLGDLSPFMLLGIVSLDGNATPFDMVQIISCANQLIPFINCTSVGDNLCFTRCTESYLRKPVWLTLHKANCRYYTVAYFYRNWDSIAHGRPGQIMNAFGLVY